MRRLTIPTLVFILVAIAIVLVLFIQPQKITVSQNSDGIQESEEEMEGGMIDTTNPLTIENLRKGDYPGSELVIEQTLSKGSGYERYIASYKSEGLKIFGLLTTPTGSKPEGGWPVVIFNHGYIAPSVYRTTEKYVAYQDAFAKAGYITFKSDYRGHGNSEGDPYGAYGSNDYTIDVLNATASLKRYQDANPQKIGMWGHSMGGFITLRNMVVTGDIKAGVIWAGVVGTYQDMLENWRRRPNSIPSTIPATARRWRDLLVSEYGTPGSNPEFWNSISANSYLKDISGPLQLHHGTADTSVPLQFSQRLEEQMKEASQGVELFIYDGDDHNLSQNLSVALKRSVAFFDQYLKK